MAGGRPTKYSEQILIDAQNYIDNHLEFDDLVPSHAGLAYHLKIGKRTVYDWAEQEDKKEFSHMLAQILTKQEKMLLSGGLSSSMNATIVKLMLSKHDYSDKVEQDITSGGKKIENNFIITPVSTEK
jgi:hypothetical protein